MNKFDLVRLINEKPYLKYNVQKDMRGIVIDCGINRQALTMFFNPHNLGEYVMININNSDLVLEKEKLPTNIQMEILQKIDRVISKASDILRPVTINEYDMVELIVEEDKYSKFGIHKGDRGIVMDNKAIQNYIEVDFSGIDENGNYYGDCISVKIEDLKVVK